MQVEKWESAKNGINSGIKAEKKQNPCFITKDLLPQSLCLGRSSWTKTTGINNIVGFVFWVFFFFFNWKGKSCFFYNSNTDFHENNNENNNEIMITNNNNN